MEEEGRGKERPLNQMRTFREFVEKVGLVHVGLEGRSFTMCNIWEGDQCTRGKALKQLFPYSRFQFIHSSHSSHKPIMLVLEKPRS